MYRITKPGRLFFLALALTASAIAQITIGAVISNSTLRNMQLSARFQF